MDDAPITLEEACKLYPGSAFKEATLRAEAKRGRLDIFLLGRRYHTTPEAMDAWVRLCQDEAKGRGSTFRRVEATSSATDRRSSALAALNLRLSKLSRATSRQNTSRSRHANQ